MRQIKTRTLLLFGTEEVICKLQAAVTRAKELIQNLKAELVPNASHGLPMEQAALVNRRIVRFLDQE